jgi:hypothetical protein
LKDQFGDQRGGSEWDPIKILPQISQTVIALEPRFGRDDMRQKVMLCPQNSWPLTPYNVGNRASHELNQGQKTPPKDHRIEVVFRRLRGQDHPQRGTMHSPMILSKKSEQKPSQICGINRRTKTPKRHQKRPMETTTPNLLYNQERVVQGLACLLNIHPSLKISP